MPLMKRSFDRTAGVKLNLRGETIRTHYHMFNYYRYKKGGGVMANFERLTEDEKELIMAALQVSKSALHNVYTRDWLEARIGDIEKKLQIKLTCV
jgi:hypothetical protein